MLTEQERVALDAKLSPFKRWDIVADIKGELIWIFKGVGYQWRWLENPSYIFAEFQRAISKQWGIERRVYENWYEDKNTSIDKRNSDLSENYKLATEEQVELFKILMKKEQENREKKKEKRKLRMKKKRKAKKW